MVAGGAQVYAAALPYADEQLLSEVHLEPEGDTFYPDFDRTEWLEIEPRAPRGVRPGAAGAQRCQVSPG